MIGKVYSFDGVVLLYLAQEENSGFRHDARDLFTFRCAPFSVRNDEYMMETIHHGW